MVTKENEQKADEKFYKLIKIKEVKDALAKSEYKKIVMNIYPVKQSNHLKKRDFDLKIIYQDWKEHSKNLGSKFNNKLFSVQSTNYVSYLKSKNISMKIIPHGYYLEIDEASIKNIAAISFYLSPEDNQLEYYLLSETGEQKDDDKTLKPDSTCKCPPECCNLVVSKGDSTGKCPPECPKYPLLLDNTMKTIINKVYK